MAIMIRFLPGVLAALLAFLAQQILNWLDVRAFWWELLVFVVVYVVCVVSLDKAFAAYADQRRPGTAAR